jgi:hypothetical protein
VLTQMVGLGKVPGLVCVVPVMWLSVLWIGVSAMGGCPCVGVLVTLCKVTKFVWYSSCGYADHLIKEMGCGYIPVRCIGEGDPSLF